jgi:hypothetical protein
MTDMDLPTRVQAAAAHSPQPPAAGPPYGPLTVLLRPYSTTPMGPTP